MAFGCSYSVFDHLVLTQDTAPKTGTLPVFFVYQNHSQEKKLLSLSEQHPDYHHVQQLAQQHTLSRGKVLHGENFLLVSLGVLSNSLQWEKAGGQTFLNLQDHKHLAFHMESFTPEQCRSFLFGFSLRAWRFDKYHTHHRPLNTFGYEKVYLIAPQWTQGNKELFEEDRPVVESLHWARAMANEPGNAITPTTFMEKVKEFEALGLKVRVLDKVAMKDFGALLGVAQGSEEPPYLLHVSWEGAQEDPTVLVGKGVTFDSGGLSLKPAHSMEDMKMDKTGAVNVAALLRLAALRKIPCHLVGIMALVENMPSGTATRPGDILTSLSGQTIEVLNTDAEGRLILADALTYVQEFYQYKIKHIMDMATLTGAVSVALGSVFAGIFSNDKGKDLRQALENMGEKVGELVWPLPLHSVFHDAMNSPLADMKNIAGPGVGAGSSTAAQFLERFVSKKISWVHLDIAGVDHRKSDDALCPRGASAFGLRLLWSYIEHSCADNKNY